MADRRWPTADGRSTMADRRWPMADGRWTILFRQELSPFFDECLQRPFGRDVRARVRRGPRLVLLGGTERLARDAYLIERMQRHHQRVDIARTALEVRRDGGIRLVGQR